MKKIIVFKDGNTRTVIGELGKYWLTGEDRVRKLSRQIAEIRELPEPETDTEAKSAKAKKRPAAKKKKAEETPHQPLRDSSPQGKPEKEAEAQGNGERGE